jgi:RND family efflux transporter MFP subunit
MSEAVAKVTLPSRSRGWLYCVVGILAMLSSTVLTGCGNRSAAKGPEDETKAKGTLEVPIVKPTRQTITRLIQQPGYIKAYEETPIYSNIEGYLDKIDPSIDKDKRVRESQILVQLRVPEREADLRSKEARIKQAAAEVIQAQEGLHAASANVQTSESLVVEATAGIHKATADRERWLGELDRAKKFFAKDVSDKQSVAEAQSQYDQAQANLEQNQAKLKSAQANLIESKAKESKAAADVEAAKARKDVEIAARDYSAAMLEYRNIRAPYDGVITQRNVDSGAKVMAAGGNTPGAKPLFVVMSLDQVRVTVQVPETDGVILRTGDPATIHFTALRDGDREFTGKVTRTSYALDERARTLLTEIQLPNTPDQELKSGMYANVTIEAQIKNAWTLPNDALISDEGDKKCCYCVENGKAVRTPVRVGTQTNTTSWVIKKRVKSAEPGKGGFAWVDFTGNEEIVAKNASSLTDGQVVGIAK